MKYVIDVPDYDPNIGMTFKWEDGFRISTRTDQQGTIILTANPEGLISLARHLLLLSQLPVPEGYHFHLDVSNSLEGGSQELIIERG